MKEPSLTRYPESRALHPSTEPAGTPMIYFDSSHARVASVAGVLRDLGWSVQIVPTPEGTSSVRANHPRALENCMAAGVLPEPGSKHGPCYTCKHVDCRATHADAGTPCEFCTRDIGYGTGFYRAQQGSKMAHADCLEIAAERKDPRVAEFS